MLPQLNAKKKRFHGISDRMKKERVVDHYSSPNYIDYTIANYDIDEAARQYNEVSKLISMYQLELDKMNMTEMIEVEI